MNQRKSVPSLWFALSIAVAVALFAAGCKREAPPSESQADTAVDAPADAPPEMISAPTDATQTPAIDEKAVAPPPMPAPAPGTDAVVIENHATPVDAAPGFDAKAFAGRYASGKTALDVTSEGTFLLDDNGSAIPGSWTLMPDGKTIVLDPDSKGENDRRIEVLSKDNVKLIGSNLTLKRENATH